MKCKRKFRNYAEKMSGGFYGRSTLAFAPPSQAEPHTAPPIPSRPPHVTVALACGGERVSFRVSRYDHRRLFTRGKAQSAATIGRRIALALEAML